MGTSENEQDRRVNFHSEKERSLMASNKVEVEKRVPRLCSEAMLPADSNAEMQLLRLLLQMVLDLLFHLSRNNKMKKKR